MTDRATQRLWRGKHKYRDAIYASLKQVSDEAIDDLEDFVRHDVHQELSWRLQHCEELLMRLGCRRTSDMRWHLPEEETA